MQLTLKFESPEPKPAFLINWLLIKRSVKIFDFQSHTDPWPQMQIRLTESISRLCKSRWLGSRLSKRHLFSNRISGASVGSRGADSRNLACCSSLQPSNRAAENDDALKRPRQQQQQRQPPMVLPRVAGDDSSFKRVAPTSPFDLAALFAFSLCATSASTSVGLPDVPFAFGRVKRRLPGRQSRPNIYIYREVSVSASDRTIIKLKELNFSLIYDFLFLLHFNLNCIDLPFVMVHEIPK